jgi:hypothetical protein
MSWPPQNNYSSQISSQGKTISDLQNQLKALNESIANKYSVDENTGLLNIGGSANRYGQYRPDYLTLRDESGQLADQFQMGLGDSFSALKDKAMTEGDTEAARLAREQQGIMKQADVDSLRQLQATGVNQGLRNLAMRGGVSTGSRERLMRDATRQGLKGFQGIGRENRLANLNISQQDEAMKNSLLGQVGGVEQMVQEGNIGRLATDIQNQNQYKQGVYSDDMAAYGAQQQAKAQRKASSGCFSGDTKVMMIDGTEFEIRSIALNSSVYEGGRVTATMQFISDDLYNYKGVHVTGQHAVKEDEKWIRVQDSANAKKLPGSHIVYNLNCENHIMRINDMMFADYDETDFGSSINDDQSLEVLNGKNVRELL